MGRHKVSSGEEFLTDDYLDEMVSECRWQILRGHKHLTTYVRGRNMKTYKSVLLHRILIGANPGEEVDHINGDGMDNRLENLRIVNRAQNQQNRKHRHDSKTGCRGIRHWEGYGFKNPWQARLTVNGVRVSLGFFAKKEDAILAYNCKVKEVHGELAYLNKLEN